MNLQSELNMQYIDDMLIAALIIITLAALFGEGWDG